MYPLFLPKQEEPKSASARLRVGPSSSLSQSSMHTQTNAQIAGLDDEQVDLNMLGIEICQKGKH